MAPRNSKNNEIYRFLCIPWVLLTMVPRNNSTGLVSIIVFQEVLRPKLLPAVFFRHCWFTLRRIGKNMAFELSSRLIPLLEYVSCVPADYITNV